MLKTKNKKRKKVDFRRSDCGGDSQISVHLHQPRLTRLLPPVVNKTGDKVHVVTVFGPYVSKLM